MKVILTFEPEDTILCVSEISKAISRCESLHSWVHKGPKERNKQLAELKTDDEKLMRLVRDAYRLGNVLGSVQSQNITGTT